MLRFQFYLTYFYFILLGSIETLQKAKDNGDMYIVPEEAFIKDIKQKMQTESSLMPDNSGLELNTPIRVPPENSDIINFDEVISTCNSSFYIPMHYYIAFNTTAELPDLVDKTGMCFIRCLYEKSGLIKNWKLNVERIHSNIWPAMGDTIEVCEQEGAKEENACIRTYAIAKCLTIRSLVDARSQPV